MEGIVRIIDRQLRAKGNHATQLVSQRFGRKNRKALHGKQIWKPRSIPRLFSGTLERLEDRRLLAVSPLNINGDQSFVGENDVFILKRDAADPTMLDVTQNGGTTSYALSSISQINVFGYAGNDSLTVDDSNGLIQVQNGIHFDGGTGFDSLTMTGGSKNSANLLEVGGTPGSGISLIENASDVQEIDFQNLEPVSDLTPSATFEITSVAGASILNASNAINVSFNTQGTVTIDNYEPITFDNKQTFVLESGAGDDTINVGFPALSPILYKRLLSMARIPPPATLSSSTAPRAMTTSTTTRRPPSERARCK